MTEAAQEHLTGMPTPNFALPWTITNTHREHVDITDARGKSVLEQIRADYATLIVKAVNAYGSTDALRSALANLVNTEALKNVKGLVFSVYRNEPRDREAKIGTYTGALFDLADAIDAARAALSDSPAPKTCRACKGFGCVDDDPEVRGSVTECWKCGGSGFDSPAPSTEGLREALEKIEGGSFPGASTLAINGDWKGIVDQLQSIARTALAGVTAPSEVPDA